VRFFFNHALSEHAHIFDMLRDGNPDVFVAASHARADSVFADRADRFEIEPFAKDADSMPAGYADWLLDAAKRAQAEVVVPYRHRIALADWSEVFAQNGVRLLAAAGRETLEFVEDKPNFLAFANSIGVTTAPGIPFRTLEDFHVAKAGLKGATSLCIKPATGIGGVGYRRLIDEDGPDAAHALLGENPMVMSTQSLVRLLERGPFPADMLLMPYLSGPECSLDIACWAGKVLGAVARHKLGRTKRVGDDPEARAMAEILVEALGLSGMVNLPTRRLPGGEPCLLEMNTRASGGIGQTAQSGVNLPHLVHEALQGKFPAACQIPKCAQDVAKRHFYAVVGERALP